VQLNEEDGKSSAQPTQKIAQLRELKRRRRVVVGLENDDSLWREVADLDKEGTIKVMAGPVSNASEQTTGLCES
jgi:uncharacterized protein YpmB